MVIKKIYLIITFFLCTGLLSAQAYFTAAGVRFGEEFGITLQQRILKRTTIEGIVQSSFRNDITTLTLLVEQHQKLLTKGFNFYLGAGPHKSWIPPSTVENEASAPAGITLVAGAELTLGKLNLSLDYKPQVNIWGGSSDFNGQSGLSLRYAFVKRIKKKKKFNVKFWEKNKKKKKRHR